MISRSIWRKVLLCPSIPCTLSLSLNSPPYGSSSTNIFGLVLSVLPIPLMELWSFLFGRRMDLSDSVSFFRGLNKISKKDRYPLLFISNLLTSTGKAHIHMALDLHHAYHLVHIAEGDEWKTAFRTCYGSFEWMVMPFGFTNAPSAFQRFMNNIFSNLLDVTVTIYLDNILIYSDDPLKHKEHVCKILHRLQKHSLYCHPDKCKFSVDYIDYLSVILSKDG